MNVSITVNGQQRSGEAEPRMLLVHFIRDVLGLTGTHVGCEHGVCGACTILLDGVPVRSCLMFAVQADGHAVTTIEGLAQGGELHPMQKAFHEKHALQCGFCTPGMIMQSIDLIKEHPDPDERTVRDGLEGNLCRCTGYQNIVAAVQEAARTTRESAVSTTEEGAA